MKKHFLLPTNLNKDPYLSVWWMEDCNPTVFFMQVSEDDNNPLWIKCGDILELLCRKELDTDTNFMEMIMSAFRSKEHTPAITHIKEVIIR